MVETVQVIKGIWGDASLSFAGYHYTVSEFDGTPTSLQQPHRSIFTRGGGKRMLSYAARVAQTVGIMPVARPDGGLDGSAFTAEALERRVAWVRAAAGDRFGAIELSIIIMNDQIVDHHQQVIEQLTAQLQAPVDLLETSPYFPIGSVD